MKLMFLIKISPSKHRLFIANVLAPNNSSVDTITILPSSSHWAIRSSSSFGGPKYTASYMEQNSLSVAMNIN